MVRLERIEATAGMARFYTLLLVPNLFEEWELVAEWGRIGSPGTVQRQSYPTEAEAVAAMHSRMRRKQVRGYKNAQGINSMPACY